LAEILTQSTEILVTKNYHNKAFKTLLHPKVVEVAKNLCSDSNKRQSSVLKTNFVPEPTKV
jgi:predicted house-cleaning noncanonical NTP pyrophosphatase (MazG superfamily)